jgi:hypothetical protein
MGCHCCPAHVFAGYKTGPALLAQLFCLIWKKNNPAALPQPEGLFVRYGQRRDVVQRGLNGQKAFGRNVPMA